MRQDDAIASRLAEVLATVVEAERAAVARDTRLRGDRGIGSLARIDVVVAAEDEFGVAIPDEDAERFATVGDVIDSVRRAGAAA